MQFKSLPLYRPKERVLVPPSGIDGKNISFVIFPENDVFLNMIRSLGIKPSFVKNVFMPTTVKIVRTRLRQPYKVEVRKHKLIPHKGFIGDYSNLIGKNFYLDYSVYLDALASKFKVSDYRRGRPAVLLYELLQSIDSIPEESHQRVLLYAVNTDKPFSPSFFKRRSFSIFLMLKRLKEGKIEKLPFDKIVLFLYNAEGKKFILLYDKNKKMNFARIRNILFKLKPDDEDDAYDKEFDDVADDAVETSVLTREMDPEKKSKLKSIIKKYIGVDDHIKDQIVSKHYNKDRLISNAISYNIKGDQLESKDLATKITKASPDAQKKIIKKHSENFIPRPVVNSAAQDPFIVAAKPLDLVDGQMQSHIYKKRRDDFEVLLKSDIVEAFNVLGKKPIPLKVKNVNIKTVRSPISELMPTVKDRYEITISDDKGKEQLVHIDLPHLTENGTFISNGEEKVLINQMITYPIFFLKPYSGKFESSYAVVHIHSKELSKYSYLIMYMGGYKVPITMWYGYKYGISDMFKRFGVTYQIHDEKVAGGYQMPDGRWFTYNAKDDVGNEIAMTFIHTFASIPKTKILDLDDRKLWRNVLESFCGNRNCIYQMEQVWENVVTPVEINILSSRGDPTEIFNITKYICVGVVSGRVDDRNGIDKLRIRSSEIFVSYIQGQVLSAYNEYLSKRLGGDDNAEFYINPTKAYSDLINSQNIQQFEKINPLEEISAMTRITPVGLGGIPNKESFPENARNNHYTYYGNIDPLETPDNEMIGIQQHLTTGSTISNIRGLFEVRDRDKVTPTGILSAGPSMIPFVESNSGPRVTMASAQLKQAIPLENPEPPMIQTGYESLYTPLLSDNFIKKSPVDGVVIDVNKRDVIIKGTDGKKHTVDISSVELKSGMGKSGLSEFTPLVKIGSKVRKNSIIAEGANVKDGIISNGLNVLVGFMPWKGHNFEDAMIVSESLAKKFSSRHIENYKSYLKENDDVINIIKIGDYAKKGDVLLTYSNMISDVESNIKLRVDNPGVVTNIEVFSNVPENEIPSLLKDAYKATREEYIRKYGKYPIGQFKELDEKFDGIMVNFVVEERSQLTIGDKITNRNFNKGVLSCYDTRTYVFSKKGWKLFSELSEEDELLYMMENGKASYTKPTRFVEDDYEGYMYGHNYKWGVNYLVTPNHRMYFTENRNKELQIINAEDMHGKKGFVCPTVDFNFKETDEEFISFEFEETQKPYKTTKYVYKFNKKDFYQFYGWYVTEGNLYAGSKCNGKKITITQTDVHPEYVQEISELLTRMGFTWCRSKGTSNFTMTDNFLYEYLSQYGEKCYNKRIPEWMFDTTKENLEILFQTMIKGDGSYRRNSSFGFYSTSKELMDDFCRLATLLGYKYGKIMEDNLNRKRTKYIVYISTDRYKKEINLPEKYYFKEWYSGKIYCVSVPNGLLYVKREDGVPFWCGNSIEKDENMPIVEINGRKERLDMLYNPVSVINRMNTGQILEMHCGLISRELSVRIEKMTRTQFEQLIKKVLRLLDGTDNQKLSKNWVGYITSLSSEAYSKFKNRIVEKKAFPLIFPPFKTPPRKNILMALETLGLQPRYNTYLPEYNKKTDPVAIGYIYVLKLEHQGEKKLHARSIGPYLSRTLSPTAGKKRDGGQKLGENDLFSLLAWDVPHIVDEMFGALSSDHSAKNQMVSEIIQTGSSGFKESTSNPVGEIFSMFMLAIHLESK